jgi:hypothetical protein
LKGDEQKKFKVGLFILFFTFMKKLLLYVKDYFITANKTVLVAVTMFVALLVFINYHFQLDGRIHDLPLAVKLFAWYGVFIIAFGVPYLFQSAWSDFPTGNKQLWWVLIIAPFLFSLKLSLPLHFHFSDDTGRNNYWEHIVYWPLLLLIILTLVFISWPPVPNGKIHSFGLTNKNIEWRPYLLMLVIMIPLIALAATRPDFQDMYPKMRDTFTDTFHPGVLEKILFELSYGCDFFTIEFFFRGALVIFLARYAGRSVILPMAAFYCTIHFGKPLGECISSYFGGMLLGIIAYNTRSVLGGLLVHLGIAWMMELAAFLV